MGQLDFYLKQSEKISFFEFVIGNGCKIIPDINYLTDNYVVFETLGDLLECNDTSQLFFINARYSLFPMEMRQIEKNGKRVYYISQRSGGPAINFYSPSTIEVSDSLVGHGHIAFYPSYYTGPALIKIPADLKEIYNLFVSFIKKRSRKVVLLRRAYWVGHDTIESVKEGKLKLVSNDLTELVKKI